MKNAAPILQIVPHAPGSHDGVGDYAARLAERLKADYGRETKFAVPPLEPLLHDQNEKCNEIILHYVNYGYQKRGIPMRLPALISQLKKKCGGKLLTIFHELYASGPPWGSAFWLQPWQKSVARDIAHISDHGIVSSEVMRAMLQHLAPEASLTVHPVVSTLGEPSLSPDQFVRRDPHRWVIFGGTHLLRRSLKTFRQRAAAVPDFFSPRELFVLGGSDDTAVRNELDRIRGIACHYQPAIEASAASEIIASCSFAWIDYFRHRDVPTAAILKSGSYASYCTHGVIPILPREGSCIAIRGDQLPGPFFVEANRMHLPALQDRAKVAVAIHGWYQRHASSGHLAKAVAALLQLKS